MRPKVLAIAASLTILAGCGGSNERQAGNAAANSSAATAAAAANSAAAVAVAPVSGQAAKRVMHERHEGMEAIGKANKALRRQLDSASPDLAAVRQSTARIADLAQKSLRWFPPGTGPDVGKTGAKPAIWENPQDFAAKGNDFHRAAQALNAAAAGNDIAAIKARFGDLGKSCKACHDKYRAEMKH